VSSRFDLCILMFGCQDGMRIVLGWSSRRRGKRSGERGRKSGRRLQLIAPTVVGRSLRVTIGESLFTTIHAMSRGNWPSVEGGIEVSIDVHSVLERSIGSERSACRCLCIRTDLVSQPDQPSILQPRRCFPWKLRPWLSPSRSSHALHRLPACFPPR
jgi:hypothetical protein